MTMTTVTTMMTVMMTLREFAELNLEGVKNKVKIDEGTTKNKSEHIRVSGRSTLLTGISSLLQHILLFNQPTEQIIIYPFSSSPMCDVHRQREQKWWITKLLTLRDSPRERERLHRQYCYERYRERREREKKREQLPHSEKTIKSKII